MAGLDSELQRREACTQSWTQNTYLKRIRAARTALRGLGSISTTFDVPRVGVAARIQKRRDAGGMACSTFTLIDAANSTVVM